MVHEFDAVNQRWACLLLLRVVGNAIVYADARGIDRDFVTFRHQLISVLSRLSITERKKLPKADKAERTATQTGQPAKPPSNDLREEERKSIYSKFHRYLNTDAMIDAAESWIERRGWGRVCANESG